MRGFGSLESLEALFGMVRCFAVLTACGVADFVCWPDVVTFDGSFEFALGACMLVSFSPSFVLRRSPRLSAVCRLYGAASPS